MMGNNNPRSDTKRIKNTITKHFNLGIINYSMISSVLSKDAYQNLTSPPKPLENLFFFYFIILLIDNNC